ncbi:hypothetical protein [Blattabacterium cuenoti]|nr:hypothetical protein [Blattabacterium cuenoti]
MMEGKHNKILKKKELNQKYNSILNHSTNNPKLILHNNIFFIYE